MVTGLLGHFRERYVLMCLAKWWTYSLAGRSSRSPLLSHNLRSQDYFLEFFLLNFLLLFVVESRSCMKQIRFGLWCCLRLTPGSPVTPEAARSPASASCQLLGGC